MLLPIVISLAVLLAATLAILHLRSRRRPANHAPSKSNRPRSILDDCGEDVIWEVGKMRPISASKEFEAQYNKRAFLQRLAFTVSATLVAWLASRGQNVALGSSQRPADDDLSRKHNPMEMDAHQDSKDVGQYNDHSDIHSDGGEDDNHMDGHSDAPGTHTDTGG